MSEVVVRPTIGRNVFIAPTAYVGGEVVIGDECTIMHHVSIRGDVSPIRIGSRVNVQDGAVVHTDHGIPLDIGDNVGIGHRAVVHCRRIASNTLIGIGALLLDGCEIGEECLVAAGCVVPPGMIVPSGKLVMGLPGRVIRDVSEKDREYLAYVAANYVELGRRHAAGMYPSYAVPTGEPSTGGRP